MSIRLGLYTLLMSFSSLLALGKVILFGSILSPEEFGGYSIFLLLSTLILFLSGFGADVCMMRCCSRAIARHNNNLLASSFTSVVSLIVLLLPVFFVVSMILWILISLHGKYQADIAIWSGGCAWIQLLSNALLARVRAEGKIVAFSATLVLRNIIVCIFGGMLLKEHHNILPLMEILSYLVTLPLCCGLFKFHIAKFKPALLLIHLKMGWPLSVSYLLRMGSKNTSDFILLIFTSAHVYGVFAFVSVNYNIILTLINMIAQSIMPEWMKTFSKHRDRRLLFEEMTAFFIKHIVLVLMLCTCLCLMYMFSIRLYFPQYMDSYSVVPIYYIGLFLLFFSQIDNYFIIVGKSKEYLGISVLVVCSSVVINLCAVWLSPTIESLIVAFATVRGVAFSASFYKARKSAFKNVPEHRILLES